MDTGARGGRETAGLAQGDLKCLQPRLLAISWFKAEDVAVRDGSKGL